MEMILTGAGIYFLTYFVGQLKKKFSWISLRLVVVILCLIVGAIYFYFSTVYPEIRQQALKFATGSFAVSQALWMFMDKILPADVK